MKEEIYLYEKDGDEGELYGKFYECPLCESSNIFQNFNYCPDCGAEITWKEE